MPKLMLKLPFLKKMVFAAFLSCFSAKSQNAQTFQQLENLIDDAIFLTERYITPATDAAVYQAASNWIITPKKSELWNFMISVHLNNFLVPTADRTFDISNSDMKFFKIQNTNTATIQTALGSNQFETLVGQLDGNDVSLKTPEGIDRKTVIYPFIQTSLGLPFGTELIAKYSPKTALKNVTYQVYGLGIKYNLSQYFENLEAQNIYFSTLIGYSNEDISVNFLDVQTNFGNLGLNSLNSKIDTWQCQFNASKEFNKLELSAGIILNSSNFKYKVDGEKGAIENLIPLQDIINNRLLEIDKSKTNLIGEVAVRYKMGHVYLQTSLAFGKFLNSNFSVQYQFNQ